MDAKTLIETALPDYLNRDIDTLNDPFWQGVVEDMAKAYEQETKATGNFSASSYSMDGYTATLDIRPIFTKYAAILAPYKRPRTVTQNDRGARGTNP